jgi:hypothetical protein
MEGDSAPPHLPFSKLLKTFLNKNQAINGENQHFPFWIERLPAAIWFYGMAGNRTYSSAIAENQSVKPNWGRGAICHLVQFCQA